MKFVHNCFILMIGAVFMLNLSGCSSNLKYEKYISKNPAIDFTVDRISGWEAQEQIGSFNSFIQLCFYEPVIKGKGLRAMMVITVEESSKIAITPKTLDGLKADIIKKRMLFNSAKVLTTADKKFFGSNAISIDLSYKTIADPVRTAKLVPYKEKIIIFERNREFYIVRYANLADDFDNYSKAFDHIVKSIKFK